MEEKVNLNGEFLGISALAVYSAPWFLQIPLLLLVALLFALKVAIHSGEIQALTGAMRSSDADELDQFLSRINYAFFGFAVPRKNLSAYWTGFAIYLITLSYAIYNQIAHLMA